MVVNMVRVGLHTDRDSSSHSGMLFFFLFVDDPVILCFRVYGRKGLPGPSGNEGVGRGRR